MEKSPKTIIMTTTDIHSHRIHNDVEAEAINVVSK